MDLIFQLMRHRFVELVPTDPDEAINVLWSRMDTVLNISVVLFKRRSISAQKGY